MDSPKDDHYLRKELYDLIKSDDSIFDFIQQSSLDGMWYWDLENPDHEWMNEKFWQVLGYDPKKMAHSPSAWQSIINQDDLQQAHKLVGEHLKDPSKLYEQVIRYNHAEGYTVWIKCRGIAIRDEAGKPIRMLGAHHDITDQKLIELRLKSEREKSSKNIANINAIIENTDDSIWAIDTDYKLTFINNRFKEDFKQSFGYELKVGDDVVAHLPKVIQPIYRERYTRVLNNEKFYIEDKVQTDIKSYVYIQISFNPILSDGKVIGASFFGRNVTHEKMREEELIRAKEKAEESSKLKTEFINNMSHEIRTPMNGIMGFSKLLNKEDLSVEKRTHYINIVNNSGKQLLRIIDDIIEISQLNTQQVKLVTRDVCLNDLLLELFSVFDGKAKENNTPLYLIKSLKDEESVIQTDESKLKKVLSNLLENAFKYTNKGHVELGYRIIDERLNIYVKDTGIGIPKVKQKIIFERFARNNIDIAKNVGGLGLGLSIAKENTVLLGGTIELESELGVGSVFTLKLPFIQSAEIQCATKKGEGDQQKTPIILIAEDEEINFLFIETLIKEQFCMGCKTIHAKDGKEAIEICKQNPDISLVLMDIKMPEVDGYEATKEIKKMFRDLPIVAQTAYSTKEDRDKAFAAGCDDFFSKPIDEELLEQILRTYLK